MNEEKTPFPCEKCGTCCRHIKGVPEVERFDRGDGVCKYYDENKKECKIYDFRPEVCNVEKLYKRYKNTMTWDEYIKENKRCCEVLRNLEKNKK